MYSDADGGELTVFAWRLPSLLAPLDDRYASRTNFSVALVHTRRARASAARSLPSERKFTYGSCFTGAGNSHNLINEQLTRHISV